MKRILITLTALLLLTTTACTKIDNTTLPSYTVYIPLDSYALWNTYGVSGLGDYRIFNRTKQLPSNFPYTALMYTGYGGVLLMMGLDASTSSYEPVAYDCACPVERSVNTTVSVNASNFEAVCPQCGSRFDVFQGSGGPLSGTALTRKVGLTIYKVRASNGGYIITNR